MISKIVAIIALKIAVCTIMGQATFAQVIDSTTIEKNLIKVREIKIEGNTVFDNSELEKIVAPFEHKELPLETILKLKDQLTEYYNSREYTNSGAFLPPQTLQDGDITIKIIEGTYEIKITGLNKLDEKYIKSRLPEIGQPLNRTEILEALEKLSKNSLIKSLSVEIEYGEVGKALVLLNVEEADYTTFFLRCTNAYSPSIGSFGCNSKFTHNNLLVTGDLFFLDGSLTEGLSRAGFYYSFPFNKLDGRVKFEINVAENEVILEEIKELGIGADYFSFLSQIYQPIISNSTESLTLGFGIQYTDSETSLFNGELSFPFTRGLKDGQSKITSLIFSQEYLKNWGSNLFAINSEFNVGIDAFDATKTQVGIDGIYWLWRGDIQSLIALDKNRNVALAIRLAGQLTPAQLLALEQFTLGGLGSVRGFIRNLQIGDNGVIGTIELRFNLFRGEKKGSLSLGPFVDLGRTWNNQNPAANTLTSTGLSLRYFIGDVFEARIDWGIPLTPVREEAQDNVTGSIRFKIF